MNSDSERKLSTETPEVYPVEAMDPSSDSLPSDDLPGEKTVVVEPSLSDEKLSLVLQMPQDESDVPERPPTSLLPRPRLEMNNTSSDGMDLDTRSSVNLLSRPDLNTLTSSDVVQEA